jgi:hypothetical protein
MENVIKHEGVEYNLDRLKAVMSQGVTVQTDTTICKVAQVCKVSNDISKTIAVKEGGNALIIIDAACRDKSIFEFEVVLLSKHILKKAKIDQTSFDFQSPYVNSGYRTPDVNYTKRRTFNNSLWKE